MPDIPFDLDAVLVRLGGDRSLFKALAQFFLEDAQPLLDNVQIAIDKQDAHALHQAAHRIKGLVANFSAADAYSAAERLEEMGRTGDLSQAQPAGERLSREVARLLKALTSYATGSGASRTY